MPPAKKKDVKKGPVKKAAPKKVAMKKTVSRKTSKSSNGMDDKTLAGIMWIVQILLIVPAIVIWAMKKDENEYVNYHFKQLLILWICTIVIYAAGIIIPFLGWFIILPLGMLFAFVLWIIGIINAFSGKKTPLPIIGKWAESFKF